MKYKKLFEANIQELEFDPQNPRLPKKLQNSNEADVVKWMLLDASLLDLIASIGTNGFFPGEPLLAIKNDLNDKYTVIEGNRRLASCKILTNPSLASVKTKSIDNILSEVKEANIPHSVPVFLFEKRSDILAYLGYRHVTGVKSWGALPKAKYLFELLAEEDPNNSLDENCRSLAKKIGSKGDYVKRLLTSYQIFQKIESNKFFDIDNLSEETIEFSNLVDSATRYSNITKYLEIDFKQNEPLKTLNEEHLEELTHWLFERDENNKTMVGENRNIRILNSIIPVPKALEDFKSGTPIKEAYLLTEVPDEIFRQSITNSLKNLKNAEDVFMVISKQVKEDTIEEIKKIESITRDFLR